MGNPCTVQAYRGVSLVLVLLLEGLGGGGALAQTPKGKTPPRTVSWYASNPQARAQVELVCLDDPGNLNRNPDCINAHQASVEVALRAARSRTGTMNPNDPTFWTNDPESRRSQLIMCRRNPGLTNCAAAQRSLQIEAGKARR